MWIGLLASIQLLGSIAALQQKHHAPDISYKSDLYSAFVSALYDFKACKSLSLCELAERFGVNVQKSVKFPQELHIPQRRKGISGSDNDKVTSRSYYGGYGAPNTAPAPTYVPAFLGFDPISILASLAFLAFMLQSFTSLFDRSRSIIPTIVTSRHSTESDVQDITNRVSRSIDKYELLNKQKTEKTTV